MSDLRQLTKDEITKARADLPTWTFSDTGISLSIKLSDFSEAFALMCRIAMLAEKHNHHPEWRNVYNKIEVTLTTHDIGGLSRKDIAMAQAINRLL